MGKSALDDSLADALAIGPVSAKVNSPILLVETNSIPQVTMDTLVSLNIKNVTIIGGEVAVSENVESQLIDIGLIVDRIAGENRNETAVKIAKKYFPLAKKILLANGKRSADSVIGGYFGKLIDSPILFTFDQLEELPKETREYLEADVLNVYLIGGTKVISELMMLKILATPKASEKLTITSIDVLNSTRLNVVLSDNNKHQIKLARPLKANTPTSVTFEIDGIEYTASVTWYISSNVTPPIVIPKTYAVTFKDTNIVDLKTASIEVKFNETVITNLLKLQNGVYSYTVKLEGFKQFKGDFTVSGTDLEVEVTLVKQVEEESFLDNVIIDKNAVAKGVNGSGTPVFIYNDGNYGNPKDGSAFTVVDTLSTIYFKNITANVKNFIYLKAHNTLVLENIDVIIPSDGWLITGNELFTHQIIIRPGTVKVNGEIITKDNKVKFIDTRILYGSMIFFQ